jgi:hypothetical protein
MNRQEVEDLILALWNKQGHKWHSDLMEDVERLHEYRRYSWFTETYEPLEDLDWSEIIPELNDGEVDGYFLESVEHFGGEGQGDHIHWVFTVTDPEGNVTYWKKHGYYASYSGSYWDDGDLEQVTPRTKQVRVYE